MSKTRTYLLAVLGSAALLFLISNAGQSAQAGSFVDVRDYLASGDATGLDSAFWTGWVDVGRFHKVHIELTTADANDSVTNVVMRCETSDSSATADDGGADVCCRSVASGVETYTCPCDKKHNPGAAGKWSWTVDNIHAKYLSCELDAEGTAAAADTAAWIMRGEQ